MAKTKCYKTEKALDNYAKYIIGYEQFISEYREAMDYLYSDLESYIEKIGDYINKHGYVPTLPSNRTSSYYSCHDGDDLEFFRDFDNHDTDMIDIDIDAYRGVDTDIHFELDDYSVFNIEDDIDDI